MLAAASESTPLTRIRRGSPPSVRVQAPCPVAAHQRRPRAGAETTPLRYASGCAPGTSAELWTIAGGNHLPGVRPMGTEAILDWLFAHGR